MLAFQRGPKKDSSKRPAPAWLSDGTLGDRALLCGHCERVVASGADRIEVDGAHAHRFTNPAGFTYDIVCLRAAPGCSVEGAATLEATWFPGFAWSFAHCRACALHLGWHYQGVTSFFGLIADRLLTAE